MNSPASTLPFTPKRKKLLTRPLIKFPVAVAVYIFVEEKMFIGKDLDKNKPIDPTKPKKEPATIANVIDLVTDEPSQIIVNAVVKSIFHDEYPEDTYVGKCFMIVKGIRVPGKPYDPFKVEEIDDPRPAMKEAAEKASKEAAEAEAAEKPTGKPIGKR